MQNDMGKTEIKKRVLRTVTALLLLIAISVGFGIAAKYRQELTMPGKLVIRAGLANNLEVFEYAAVKNQDGTYTLDESNEVHENNFSVIPGVDIPRRAKIRIDRDESTTTPAYLYIEVVNTLPASITMSLASAASWTKLDNAVGKNGGEVYAYSNTITGTEQISITILDGYVEASPEYLASGEYELSFYPYMVKAEAATTAAESFNDKLIGIGTAGKYSPQPLGSLSVIDNGNGAVGIDISGIEHAVYVRAAVIVNWKSEAGEFFAENLKEGVDYIFNPGTNTDNPQARWFKGSDGYYYYSHPVEDKDAVPELVESFRSFENDVPPGFKLAVTVSVQTIQVIGEDNDGKLPVESDWGCTVDENGIISKP